MQSRTCEHPGCGRSTRESKPYCSDHIEKHDYVSKLLSTLAAWDAELEAVRLKGARAVRLDGPVVAEIVQFLGEHGECTVERLKRERLSDQPLAVVQSYVERLKRAKRVTLGRSRRGSYTVELRGEMPASVATDRATAVA